MRRIDLAVFLGAVLALGACASPPPASTSGDDTIATAHPSEPPPSPSHRAIAIRDEQADLAAFRPPAGAKQLSGRPPGAAALTAPMAGLPANTVDATQWWTVDGDPQMVVNHLAVPSGAHNDGSSSGGPDEERYFGWPVPPTVLYDRSLTVAAMAVAGRTVLRVDSAVVYYPPRPASSLVPTTATAVTVTNRPASVGAQPKTYGPVTITDAKMVGALVAAVNAASVTPITTAIPCPDDLGANVTLRFHAGATGPTVATTSIDPAGCAFISMSVVGGSTITLIGGVDLAAKVKSVLGAEWPRAGS